MKTLNDNTREVGSSAYFGERGNWLIACATHRDSDTVTRSNFTVMRDTLNALPAVRDWSGDDCPVAIERFNHWAVGWVDYLLIDPACGEAVTSAEELLTRLEDYPVLSDDHLSELENNEAQIVWRDCYDAKERLEYIRKHRSQFEFHDMADLIGCARGRYFAGYAFELLT